MNEKLDKITLVYEVNTIPDPSLPKHQSIIGGSDVMSEVGRLMIHLIRTIIAFGPDSCTITIRYEYTPIFTNGNPQSRLRIFLIAQSSIKLRKSLSVLFSNGPLCNLYRVIPIESHSTNWSKIKASCSIVRRENFIKPLHPTDLNHLTPKHYYCISLFYPNNNNGFLELDRILSGCKETIILNISLRHTDISSELASHTDFLTKLSSLNRSWDTSDYHDINNEDYLGDGSDSFPSRHIHHQQIKPLKYSDPLADDILRHQQKFQDTLSQPNLLFNISIFAETEASANLFASVVAESSFENGEYSLIKSVFPSVGFSKIVGNAKQTQISLLKNSSCLVQQEYPGFCRLNHIATAEELSGIFRLPVASPTCSPHCIAKDTDPPLLDLNREHIKTGTDPQSSFLWRGIDLLLILKHQFVCGLTGFGKTMFLYFFLLQLNYLKIPFLVIEPVKTEYRELKTLGSSSDENARNLAEKLEIYSVGNEAITPLRFNPLEIPPGISIDEHIDRIQACLTAAMPVSGPLPFLLSEALETIYEDYQTVNNAPTMTDLLIAVEKIMHKKEYSSETKADIKSALKTRLKPFTKRSVGKIFQCRHSVPQIDDLLNVPTIMELDSLHEEQACIFTLFYLTILREYFSTIPWSGSKPRYAIIIEEAHVIIGRNSNAGPSNDNADIKANITKFILRLIVELRALGVSITLVDQNFSGIAPDIIKNITSKVVFCQTDDDDRQAISASMLFNQQDYEEIARFKTGEAFIITEGYFKARKIITPNIKEKYTFMPVGNERILPFIENEFWFKKAKLARTRYSLSQLKDDMDSFDSFRMNLFVKMAELSKQYVCELQHYQGRISPNSLEKFTNKAEEIKDNLLTAYSSFKAQHICKYLQPNLISGCDSLTRCFFEDLVERFEETIKPSVEATTARLYGFIDKCRKVHL